MLEYATAVWDPYRAKDINKLDMVQCRAAHFVKRDYQQTTSVSSILDQPGWPSLSSRRLNSRLRIFGKEVAEHMAIIYKYWRFGPTLKADLPFWFWSLLYYSGCSYWCCLVSFHCDLQVSIDGHRTYTAFGLETFSFYRSFYCTTCTCFHQFGFSYQLFPALMHSCSNYVRQYSTVRTP